MKPLHRARVRRLLILLLLPLLLLLGATLFLALQIVDQTPLVEQLPTPTVEDARRARILAEQVLRGLEKSAVVSASEDELNTLLVLAAHGVPGVSGRVRVTSQGLLVEVTRTLPDNPLGRFVNLRAQLLPSEDGLTLGAVQVGRLNLSRRMALAALRGTFRIWSGNGDLAALFESVRALSMSGQRVTADFGSLPNFREKLRRVHEQMCDFSAPLDLDSVARYYYRLQETAAALAMKGGSPSLTEYLSPLFHLARERSANGAPELENQAALLALAIALGDWRFAKMIRPDYLPLLPSPKGFRPKPVLAGRTDLRLHFVVTAGLKVLTDQKITLAAGEFKELLDAGRGGSGFSFVDLAADRAGVRFAEVASDPGGGARRLQHMLAAGQDESLFFPSVEGLPEKLPQQLFERDYGRIGSPQYNAMVTEIDRRIDLCLAYKQ